MNMKKTKPKKLLTVLLTLYLALSIVPITVFADSGSYAVKFYPGDYGTMTKNDQISFVYYGFDDDVNKPYYYKLNVSETETLSFASSIINVLLPNSDYEFAYWKADATVYQVGSGTAIPAGTALSSDQLQNKITVKSDVTFTAHFKQISEYPDDSVITSAAVQNVKFNYQPGDAPQATAEVYNADADKYEIAYECWQEFENNEPVAAWYSDNGSHGSLPTITEFESGKRYVYSLMLKPKDGYSFSNETAVTVNGESVKSSLSGEYLYVPAVKTITPTKQNTVITSAAVENVKLDYKNGETPRTTATAAAADRDKYDILYECWGKLEKTDEYTTKSVAYWYSDEDYCPSGYADLTSFDKDGKYEYSVRLEAKDGYIFSDSISADDITLNGKSLPEGSFAMTLDDNRTCVVTYGMNMRPGQAVEKIDFIARTNFNAGDKPSFMTSAVDPFIDLDHERWDANDGSGYGITSSDYWNERYNGKLITEFEAGKSYTYGVYFKISDLGMEEGYRFDKNTKLYINGEEITLTPDQISIDDSGETIWFMNVLTMTPTTVKVIDVVEINNVTVSFKDGDKPVFTGKSPEGVKYAYNCEWWELDSKTGAISADFFSGAYENKITAFEAGKTYHYGVYVKAVGYVESENTTYVFGPNTKLKINGEFVNYKRYEGDESDGSDGTMWVLTDLTMTPAADGHTHKYGTEWKYDESNHWHECECSNKADITAHNFKWIVDRKATTTEKGSKHEECTVCGYKKTAVDIPKIDSHNHDYGTEWKYDSTNHWHECECGNKADITAHNFKWIVDRKATTAEKGSKHEECTVCGYKKTAVDIPKIDSHNHDYGTEWKYDSTNHWHECEDGEKADITAHNFKWIIDKEATTAEKGSKHEECTVCGYKKTAVDIPAIGFGSSSDDEANKPTNTVSSESSSADQLNNTANTASPKTGNTDYMILWIVLLIAGGGVFITATAVDRKKK
jgi:Zn ribbon nucleic-acid-binding protein